LAVCADFGERNMKTEVADEKLTMTVEEYAEAADISRNTAYQAVSAGQVPSIRLGRLIRIPRAAALRQLKGEPA